MKLFLTLSFLGTSYCGFQAQKNGRSVQEVITAAAESLFGKKVDITGCSRTDSGVHANGFCVTVSDKGKESMACSIPPEKIPYALNYRLPPDIAVRECRLVPDAFHPRYTDHYKEYVYRIYTGSTRNPFEEGRSFFYGKAISDEAVAKMNQAAAGFVGEHDFTSFMASGSKITDAVRRVLYADVSQENGILLFRVAANGFLYHMVRIMVGTLLSVAEGKTDPADIGRILAEKNRDAAGFTVPACGLYLNRVVYEELQN